MSGQGALAVLASIVLTAEVASCGDATATARTLASMEASGLRHCRWARFCPANPDYVLAQASGGGVLVEWRRGRATPLKRNDGLACGWFRDSILFRLSKGGYVLLECPTLRPVSRVTLGTAVLAPGFSRHVSRVSFHVDMREEPKMPVSIPGADLSEYSVTAEERPPALRLSEHWGRTIVDGDGRTVATCARPALTLEASSDRQKALMCHGDTNFSVYSVGAAEFTVLPQGAKSWTWLPDGEALLGLADASSSGATRGTTAPILRLYRLRERREVRITVPDVRGEVDVRVLDVSSDGKALVSVDFLGPKRFKSEYERRHASEIGSPVIKSEWRILDIAPTLVSGATEASGGSH
jgi:hypothetical protein